MAQTALSHSARTSDRIDRAGPDEASRHYELALELATDSGLDDIDESEIEDLPESGEEQ